MKTTYGQIWIPTVLAGIVLCGSLFAPAAAWAVHPFQVEDTVTQGAGNFLGEFNADDTKYSSFKRTKLTGVLTAGISDEADLSLEVPYLILNPSSVTGQNERGIGDFQLKLKQRLYENEVNQSFGYQIYTGLPTGDVSDGLGTNNLVLGFKLMDQQICRNNVLHADIGYESFARDMRHWHFAQDYAIQFGLAAEHKLTDAFRALMELVYQIRGDREIVIGSHPLTFMAGVKYDVSKSWYLDLAARAGLNRDAEDYTVLAGTAWRF